MSNHFITASNIKKIFFHGTQSVSILHDINITFMTGTSYAITGVSGSGKSSLLHIIAGFDEPTTGTIVYNGTSIYSFSQQEKEQYRQQVIGFLFQKPYLIKELSVIENIMLPMQISGNSTEYAQQRAQELLNVVGLISYKDYKPGVLSGGQQQRVCLARALCNKPLFLCADEPTASLDAHNRDEIIQLIHYGVHSWGMGIIVCTHDPLVAVTMQHQLLLHDGMLQQ